MQLTLTKIKPEDIRPYIWLAFQDDEELLTNIHISPGTLDHCVDHTFESIKKEADFYKGDIAFYIVSCNGVHVGFTITINNDPRPNELYSFGINIKHRNKDLLVGWLKAVSELLAYSYYIVLWSKNDRAIQFFKRNGFSVIKDNKYLNDETKTLIVCQQEV